MHKEDAVYIYIYNVYYSAIKKDEILPFAATWMDLEKNIILGEISQTEKTNTICYHLYVKSKI